MTSTLPNTPTTRPVEPFHAFFDRYQDRLSELFGDEGTVRRLALERDFPPSLIRAVLATQPLSVYIDEAHGGRGGHVHEGLSVLEAASYHSLALSLTLGINGALFLQPVGKYGEETLKQSVFPRFLQHQNMGGLMITEPDYGSDALSMETSWTDEGDTARIQGRKHWAGLTGLADFWLMTARAKNADGSLGRDVDFFVLDGHEAHQSIVVEERYPNLGLYPIPYGLNRVDVRAPHAHKLQPTRSGLKMMLDLLHRSRVQFPGMAMGFLRRIADEAQKHVSERRVGGRALATYDQVKHRVAALQSAVTQSAAMCLFSSERAGVEHDLSKDGLAANIVKAVMTDRMQDSAQSLMQLVGAQGYRLDHVAGRAVVDSRPFQIFEGSNDILYEQIGSAVLNAMKKTKEANLAAFLRSHPLFGRAADTVGHLLDVRIDGDLPQRKLVALGRLIGRVGSVDMVLDLAQRGYPTGRINQAVDDLRAEIAGAFTRFQQASSAGVSEDSTGTAEWSRFVTT